MWRNVLHKLAAAFLIAGITVSLGCGKREKDEPRPRPDESSQKAAGAGGRMPQGPSEKNQSNTGLKTGADEPAANEEERPLKVGVIGPMTGEDSEIGRMTFEGVGLASELFNKSGGINGRPVEIIKMDNKGDAGATKEALTRLVSEGVVAIIGAPTGWSTFTPVFTANESRTVFISAGTKRHIGSSGPFVFRVSLPVEKAADELIEYSVNTAGFKTYYLVTAMEDESLNIGSAFRRAALKKGADIKAEAAVFSEADIAGAVKNLKSNMPVDAVIFAGGASYAAAFERQAKKSGVRLPVLGGEELVSDVFLKGGEAVEGSLAYAGFYPDSTDAVAKDFAGLYKRKNGRAPSELAADAYDAFMLLGASIKKAGAAKPGAVRQAMSSLKDFHGVTGVINMGPERESIRSPYILKAVKKGDSLVFSVVKDPHAG